MILSKIAGGNKCHKIFRMGCKTILDLCDLLEMDGGLKQTRKVIIVKQVLKMLYICTVDRMKTHIGLSKN